MPTLSQGPTENECPGTEGWYLISMYLCNFVASLAISNLVPLWSDNMYGIISILGHLLNHVLWANKQTTLKKWHMLLRRMCILLLGRTLCSYLLSPFVQRFASSLVFLCGQIFLVDLFVMSHWGLPLQLHECLSHFLYLLKYIWVYQF